ncbi:dentin sialophosphoprotein [Amia ocellicauda]|uniref:dentin sialophosphoprotein n=1 Tax=Amia ocellicauda TaxID=2972642 RepID=UPI0034640446
MAAARWDSPIEGEDKDTPAVQTLSSELISCPAESASEVQPCSELPQDSGKSKPSSTGTERTLSSFWKSSGLGKVMSVRKKKEKPLGSVETRGEPEEKKRSLTHGQPSPTEDFLLISSPNELGSKQSSDVEAPSFTDQFEDKSQVEKRQETAEAPLQENPVSPGNEAKPRQSEKQSVRGFIRRPVSKMFSHKGIEKREEVPPKESIAEASKDSGKTRSRSLDRLLDSEICDAVVDQGSAPGIEGEPHKSTHHGSGHMKRWQSFKKLIGQKALKKGTDNLKGQEGTGDNIADGKAEATGGETLGTNIQTDMAGQKKRRIKRSWTFQGLKRDQSFTDSHFHKEVKENPCGPPQGGEGHAEAEQGVVVSVEDSKTSSAGGEEKTPGTEHPEQEEEKGSSTHGLPKSIDHQAHEVWRSFKNLVIQKSKRTTDAAREEGEVVSSATDEQNSQDLHRPTRQQSKRAPFNRAVSLKKFILRKGKSKSIDLGESPELPKEENTQSVNSTPAEVIEECGIQSQPSGHDSGSVDDDSEGIRDRDNSVDLENIDESTAQGSISESVVASHCGEDNQGEGQIVSIHADVDDSVQDDAQENADRSIAQDPESDQRDQTADNNLEENSHGESQGEGKSGDSESPIQGHPVSADISSEVISKDTEMDASKSLHETPSGLQQECEVLYREDDAVQTGCSQQSSVRSVDESKDDAGTEIGTVEQDGEENQTAQEISEMSPQVEIQTQEEARPEGTLSQNDMPCLGDATAEINLNSDPPVQTGKPAGEPKAEQGEIPDMDCTETAPCNHSEETIVADVQYAGQMCSSAEDPTLCEGGKVSSAQETETENLSHLKHSRDQDISFKGQSSGDDAHPNGGSDPASEEAPSVLVDPGDEQKRIFYEAAAAIVRTVVSAATEQITKEQDILDSGFNGSYPNNNDNANYQDLDLHYCH